MHYPKPYIAIVKEDTEIHIIGNHHWKEVKYDHSMNKDAEPYIDYQGNKFYLSEFIRVNKGDTFYEHGFHGYTADSLWNGHLIKFCNTAEAVQIYQYIVKG